MVGSRGETWNKTKTFWLEGENRNVIQQLTKQTKRRAAPAGQHRDQELQKCSNAAQTRLPGTTAMSGTRHEDRMATRLTWPAQTHYCSQITLESTFLIYYERLSLDIRTSQFPFDQPVSHTLLPQILLSSSFRKDLNTS